MSYSDTILGRLREKRPSLWINPGAGQAPEAAKPAIDIAAAEDRLDRAQPLLAKLFSRSAAGRLTHSPLVAADALGAALGASNQMGRWLIKADHELPIAGSVKARGGFHEVLAYAERLAVEQGLVAPGAPLTALASPEARELFSRHSVVVGSTGNLGLSIGLISAALGFRAIVHMSSDAKEWKKQRLRDHGVVVIEHAGDYANAVAQGRREAEADPSSHFVDDEYSLDLFVGYAAAARELAAQLAEQNIAVDAQHPLFVYIPCGVGGAPGGIAFGLKQLFGDHVHCVFAEPAASPCMMVQMIAGDEPMSVYSLGLDNRTEADGLAVGQASLLVAPLMRTRLAGVYTLTDDQMFSLLGSAEQALGLAVEPSAAAGMAGPLMMAQSAAGRAYVAAHGLGPLMAGAVHVVWTTGGSLVPAAEYEKFLDRARKTPTNLDFGDA